MLCSFCTLVASHWSVLIWLMLNKELSYLQSHILLRYKGCRRGQLIGKDDIAHIWELSYFLRNGAKIQFGWCTDDPAFLCWLQIVSGYSTAIDADPRTTMKQNGLIKKIYKYPLNQTVVLTFPHLDKNILKIRAYCDPAFGSTTDGSSEICFIVVFSIININFLRSNTRLTSVAE